MAKKLKDLAVKLDPAWVKAFQDQFIGLFRVYDRRTNKTIGIYKSYFEATAKLWDGFGWNASRNHNELEKVDSKAAKVLFNVKTDQDP